MDLTPADIKAIREIKRWIQLNGQSASIRPIYKQKTPRMISVGSVAHKLIKAPSGGIPGRVGTLLGGVICDVWKEAATTQQIEDSGTDIKVMNWTTSAVCANGDRFGIAAWINGGWYIIAEDCNDEGSTLEPGTGSSSSGTVGDAIDTGTLTPATLSSGSYEIRFSGAGVGGGFE
jgi:hypothetical protein